MGASVVLSMVLAISATSSGRSTLQLPERAIVGGEDSNIEDRPYIAGITYNGQFSCGSTIISEKYLLTAAHCVHGRNATGSLIVRVGSSYREKEGVVHEVKRAIPHPLYKGTNILDYDMAVIELKKPIKFNKYAQPIPLVDEEPEDDELATLTGWGGLGPYDVPEKLQTVIAPIISREECQKSYKEYFISPRMLCTFKSGISVYNGDSGGPIVVDGKVAGAISFRTYMDWYEHPNGHANYADREMRDFIRKETGI